MMVIVDKRFVMILIDNMVGFGVYINVVGGDCLGKIEFYKDIFLCFDIFVEFLD